MTLPIYSLPVTFTVLFLLMLGRYFFLCFLFSTVSRKLPSISSQSSRSEQRRRDLWWSVASTAIFAASGTFLVRAWQAGKTAIYIHHDHHPWWWLPVSLGLLLILHDTYFYWTHRWLHRPEAFRRSHYAHHEARTPTAWTSFAFHPTEALVQALILPTLVMAVPVHWLVLAIFLLLMSVTGVMNHLGRELYPKILEQKLGIISAHHHQHHHEDYRKNFGLYFTWWDQLMGTEGRRS